MGILKWIFSGGSPVNIDGTPMIEGTAIDVKGHVYGTTDSTFTTPCDTSFTSHDFSSGCSDFNTF